MSSYRQMTERLMSRAGTIARERESDITESILREAADEIKSNGRKPAPEPPEGGISIRAAGRKYRIPNRTISRWVNKGYIKLLKETKNCKYISEAEFAELISAYLSDSITGRRTITKAIEILKINNN